MSRFVNEIPETYLDKESTPEYESFGGYVGGQIQRPTSQGGYGNQYGFRGMSAGGYSSQYGSKAPAQGTYGSYGANRTQVGKSIPYNQYSQKPQATPTLQKVAPPIAKGNESQSLMAGDRVRHMTFGDGEIISAKKMGADILYEVAFDKVGTKKLMATYAKLKKI